MSESEITRIVAQAVAAALAAQAKSERKSAPAKSAPASATTRTSKPAPGFVRRLIAASGTLKASGYEGKPAQLIAREIAARTGSTAEAREQAAAWVAEEKASETVIAA